MNPLRNSASPRLTLVLFLLIFVLLPGVRHAAAEKRPFVKTEGATIYYDSALREIAEAVRAAYPALKADVEKKVRWKMKARPSIFLLDDETTFEKMGGDAMIAAFVLIGKNRIVVNLASFNQFILLERTLRHELCHVLLHENIRGNLPDWLEEGICEWAGDPGKASPADVLQEPFRAFELHKGGVPLSRLKQFKGSGTGLGVAYNQGADFIRFIVAQYGEEAIPRILAALRQGKSPEQAFLAGLSKPLPLVETEWRNRIAHTARWLILLQDSLHNTVRIGAEAVRFTHLHYRAILVSVALLLMIAVFLRAMLRTGKP